MSSASLRLAAVVLGTALSVAGCDARASVDASSTTATPKVVVLRDNEPSQLLLRRLTDAPWTVAYQGERRIEQHWMIGTDQRDLIYRERVSADGQGKFAIESPELLNSNVSPADAAIWEMLQETRAGFLYRYRDFYVRDAAAFARNYVASALGTTVSIAGRACDEIVIERRKDAPSIYELAVDRETGLVLRCRETRPDGSLLQLMEFETFDTAADLTGVHWHRSPFPVRQLSRADTHAPGFDPKIPSGDGGAFTLLSTEVITAEDPNTHQSIDWIKNTLTDGVEVVFFLDGGIDAAVDPTRGVMRVPPSVGPWSIVEGRMQAHRLIGLGRVSSSDLLDLLAAQF